MHVSLIEQAAAYVMLQTPRGASRASVVRFTSKDQATTKEGRMGTEEMRVEGMRGEEMRVEG